MRTLIRDGGEFSIRLKNLRLEKGLKQADIASKIDVSVQSYSAYENGREPNYSTLNQLADIFVVDVAYLTGKSDCRQGENNHVKQLEYCKKVLSAAIRHYGATMQEDVAIEEMSELTQAIIHFRRGRESNIPEEIADVEIMLEQLKIIYQCAPLTEHFKAVKIARLEERMSNND